MIIDSLFYSGGTITEQDIIKIDQGYSIALNNDYIFIGKDQKLVKVVKYKIDQEYTYKIQKTQVKINSKDQFIKFLKDELFSCMVLCMVKNILNKGV